MQTHLKNNIEEKTAKGYTQYNSIYVKVSKLYVVCVYVICKKKKKVLNMKLNER